MQKSSGSDTLLSIGQVAEILEISIDTARRWDKKGILNAVRSDGGHRRFRKSDILLAKTHSKPKIDLLARNLIIETAPPVVPVFEKIVQPMVSPVLKPHRLAHAVIPLAMAIVVGATGWFIKLNSVEPELMEEKFQGVLAASTIPGNLEINVDTTINGKLLVNDLEIEGQTLIYADTTATLTNKTIDASKNTLKNIANSSLTNSKVTVSSGTNLTGGGDVSLGSSVSLALKNDITLNSASFSATLGVGGDATVSGNLTGNTATFSGTLGVGGELNTNQFKLTTSPTAGYILVSDANGIGTWQSITGTPGGIAGSGTLNYLPKFTPDGSHIGNSGISDTGSLITLSENATISGTLGVGGNTQIDANLNVRGDVTLNRITSGIWNGTQIGATYGGTGQTIYAVGDILYADTTTSLAKLTAAAVGNVLISGTTPSWGKVVLGTHTSGNYVSQIIGTANQIIASAATGDVTLSIPSNFRITDATLSGTLGVGGNTTLQGDLLVKGNTNLVTGSSYQINEANILSGTTLGTGVTISSLTTVGALNSGSITSGFGAIDIGADGLTAGAATLTSATISGTLGVGGHLTVTSNILPSYNGTQNIGSPTNYFQTIYANNIYSGGSVAGFWQRNSGALAPANITDDLILGSTATTGAKFQVSGTTGVISAGTWQAGVIGTQYGGTGQDWHLTAQGNVPYFGATGTLVTLAPGTTNQVFITGGTSANPSWANISSLLSAGTDITLGGTTIVTINNASTLQSVTGRGASTSNPLTLTGAGTALTVNNNATISGTLGVNTGISTPQIGSTAFGNLTLGDSQTGGVLIAPKNINGLFVSGTGNVQMQNSLGFLTLTLTDNYVWTAADTVDKYAAFGLPQTTAGQTVTLPNPTDTTAGKLIYLSNTGSTSFTFLGSSVLTGTTTAAVWNGSAWTLAGGGGLAQGTVANSTLRWNSATSQWVENTAFTVDSTGNATASGTFGMGGNATINADLAVKGNINLTTAAGFYQINGTNVLSSNTLGSGVTASSLTTVGNLLGLTVSGNATVSGNLGVGGEANVNQFKLNTAPTAGYALISDANGIGTWQSIIGGGAGGVGGSGTLNYLSKFTPDGNHIGNSGISDTGALITLSENATASGTFGIGGNTAINADLLVKGNLNLVTGSVYQINGASVLSATTLGAGVTTSSLTTVGNLTGLTVSGNASISGTFGVGGEASLSSKLTFDSLTPQINAVNNRDLQLGFQNTGTVQFINAGNYIGATVGYINSQQICTTGGNCSGVGGVVGGAGTQNYVAKWNNAGGTTIGNSNILDTGSLITLSSAASVSGALSLYSTPTIGSTAMQSLTLGDANTGNIVLANNATASGTFGIGGNTTINADIGVKGNVNITTAAGFYQINGANVLSSDTLGTGVTTSSLTTVGTLASGSIASGFGTISTGNLITTTGTIGTAGTTTFTGAGATLTSATISGTLGVGGDASFSAKITLDSLTNQINATNNRNLDLGFMNTGRIEFFNSGNFIDSAGNMTLAGTLNGVSASLGIITNSTWNGNVIGTQYGGTGQDWHLVAQGNLPYFSASGTMSTLVPGTASQVLTTSGAGANPAWTNMASLISGTANQITVSGTQTLTLSVPSDFRAPGTINAVSGLYTGATAGTQRVDASGNLVNIGNITASGNVGIGTTSPLGKLHVEGACVTGETLILRRRRRKKKNGQWEDIWDEVPIKDIIAGDEVATLDEKTGEFTVSSVRQLMNMGRQEVFELLTESGKVIKTTGKHPYLVDLKNKFNMDYIQKETYEFSEQTAKNYYVSSLAGKKIQAKIFNEKIAFTHNGWNHFVERSRSLNELITRFFALTRAEAVIKNATKIVDYEERVKPDVVIEYWVLEQIVENVLIRVVISAVNRGQKFFLSCTWKGEQEERGVIVNTKKELSLSAMPRRRELVIPQLFNKLIISRTVKWVKVKDLSMGITIATKDGWERIISVKKLNKQYVYDLEIENTHNFVANGIVAHNTTGKALVIFNETGDQNILTASASGVTKFTLDRSGNIGSATWNGTAVGATYGGTGQTTVTTGDLLYGSAANTWGKLADVATGNVLLSGGIATAPSWGQVVLGTHTSGNYVSQIIGTANQITASAATGDVTLSIPIDFRITDATLSGTLGVGGNSTLNGDLAVKGNTNIVTAAGFYQINGINVLSATVLGTGVTTSSLTTVGALASGSIASGFGTIATANTITGTTINGTTGINTGAGAGTERIDVSGNLTNIGTITSGLINGQTISSAANFTGTATVAGQLGAASASISGKITIDSLTNQINATNNRSLDLGFMETGRINFMTTSSYVDASGNISTNGQIQVGNFASAPTAIGSGALYFNTGDSNLYAYNGSSWSAVGGWGLTTATNTSGGTLAAKALVVFDGSNNNSVTTTTTPYKKAAYGVVTSSCDNAATCNVQISGAVNVTITNTTTVAKGDYVYTSATAGSAVTSAKLFDGMIGVVTDTSTSGSGYVKMVFAPQAQVTGGVAIDKGSKHNEYWLLAKNYIPGWDGTSPNQNIPPRGLMFDNFADLTKVDAVNTTVSGASGSAQISNGNSTAPFRMGLSGGQTMATSTTDNAGNTYLGSNTVNKVFYYDRTRDSIPQVQVELGIDPNWYNGVTLSVATTSSQFSQNTTIVKNPSLSTTYNGSLVKVTGTYATAAAARTIYITVNGNGNSFAWTDYNGNAGIAAMTPGTAQTLTGTGVSITFSNAKYNPGDVFKIASWVVEPTGSTRGTKAQFPERSNIIATASSVDIIDADTQKLWMRFSQGTNYALGADANNDPNSVNMLNGKMYVANNGSSGALYEIDYTESAMYRQNATNWTIADQPIAGRNTATTYNVINTSNILVNTIANDVSAAVIPNQPTQTVTVSGWGYVLVNGANSASETVNLPYKFNNTPTINVSLAGFVNSATGPSSLSGCSANSVPARNVGASAPTTTSFTITGYRTDYPSTDTNVTYCYTWTATGQVSPRQYVGVATDAGVTVINETDGTAYSYSDATDDDYNSVVLTSAGRMYGLNETKAQLEKWRDIASNTAAETNGTPDKVWDEASTPALTATAPTINTNPSLSVTEKTSTINSNNDTIYVGTNLGASVIQDNENWPTANDGAEEASGSVKYYTKDYISEEMVGDIRGMWPLSANGAISMADASVKAETLTNNGTATAVTGVRGTATNFVAASSQYLSCTDANCGGTSELDRGSGSWSMGAWIKTSTAGTTKFIMSKSASGGGNHAYQLYVTTDNKIYYTIGSTIDGSYLGISTNSTVTDGNWHYVVGAMDASTLSISIYLDGNLEGKSTTTSGTAATDSTASFMIGANGYAGPTSYFNGQIDEPFVTANALTAGQIKHMYEVGYRALQSHSASLGGASADGNQQLGMISTGTNVVGDARVDYNNQFMYVGTNSTTLGAVSKIALNSDTNVKTYNSSANVPAGGPLLIDEDTKSLAVGYNLEAVGSATTGVKTMGQDDYATATSGNFVSKTLTTAESFNQAYLWAQYTLDSSDASNTVAVWASNDGGTNYYQCNLTNTDSVQTPPEYEYFCQFNTAGSTLKTKFVFARGSTKTNTYVTRYGIAWIGTDAVVAGTAGNGLYTNTNASVANGSYIDVAHNQGTNDALTDGWVYLNGQWKNVSTATESGVISATGATVADGSYVEVVHNQQTNDALANGWVYDLASAKWVQVDTDIATASGGLISSSERYAIHTFTSTSSGSFVPNFAGSVDVLVVAGGGGGGGHASNGTGGGGAGGYLEGTMTVTAQSYPVTVGTGGAGGSSSAGSSGNNSVFNGATALGGGGGGTYNGAGVNGGSGGGGGGTSAGGSATQGNSGGLTGYGYAGATSDGGYGGGGGGAGGVGVGGTDPPTRGAGGPGKASSISGSSLTYAAGGASQYAASGSCTNGGANTGKGGGGCAATAGNGGSGIVIVRYVTSPFKIVQQDANTVRLYNYSGSTQNLRLDVSTQAYQIKQVDTNTVRLWNYSGSTQNLRLDVITGGLGRNLGTVSLAASAADVDTQNNLNSIWVNKTGTGGTLLKLQQSGTDVLNLSSTALTLTGNFLPGTDNLYSLGASSSARWKDLFLGPASLHIQGKTTDSGLSGIGQNVDYSVGVNATGKLSIALNNTNLFAIDQSGNASASGSITAGSAGFKYADGTSQTTAAAGESSGQIAAFASACPTGWTEYTAARGRYIVGTPDGATHIASTQGTALTDLENRAVGQHSHGITDPGHAHSYYFANNVANGQLVPANTTNNNFGNSNSTSSNTTGISIQNAGSVAGTNAPYIQLNYCQKSAGADLAEWVPTSEDVSAATIVSVDPANNEKLIASRKPYDSTVVGIIATKPGWLIGDETPGSAQMALAGRVPTRVTLKNGDINRGDAITTSDIAGVGMKATLAGSIIGKAMEPLNEQSALTDCGNGDKCGIIAVFVNVSYFDPATSSDQYDTLVATSQFIDESIVVSDTAEIGDMVNLNQETILPTDINDPELTPVGILGDGGDGQILQKIRLNGVLVGMKSLITSGVTEVNIASTSAEIHKGDLLGMSEINGKAKKSTTIEPIIGKALEDWTLESGKTKIRVSVQPGTNMLPILAGVSDLQNLSGLTISNISTISAQLDLNTRDIATVSAQVDKLTADVSTILSELPQIKSDIEMLKEEMASVSAGLAKAAGHPELVSGSLADASLSAQINWEMLKLVQHDNLDISTISAQFANFSESLKVVGTTQLADTTIGGSLTVGLLHFDDLKAEISSLTGNVTINSNLNVMGDATVSGQIKSKTVETDGISLKDEVTGEYYCVRMKNGEIDRALGKCQ